MQLQASQAAGTMLVDCPPLPGVRASCSAHAMAGMTGARGNNEVARADRRSVATLAAMLRMLLIEDEVDMNMAWR